MSLISEINRTETEKNKTKQVATNINNKLVELGGERATDLADVPNKIRNLVNQYEKMAIVDINKRYDYNGSATSINHTINFTINNVAFNIKKIIILLQHGPKIVGGYGSTVQYSFFIDKNNLTASTLRIQTDDYNSVAVKITKWDSSNNISLNFNGSAPDSYYVKVSKIICLG